MKKLMKFEISRIVENNANTYLYPLFTWLSLYRIARTPLNYNRIEAQLVKMTMVFPKSKVRIEIELL